MGVMISVEAEGSSRGQAGLRHLRVQPLLHPHVQTWRVAAKAELLEAQALKVLGNHHSALNPRQLCVVLQPLRLRRQHVDARSARPRPVEHQIEVKLHIFAVVRTRPHVALL